MFNSKKKYQRVVHALALSMASVLVSGCTTVPKCTGDSPSVQAKKNVARVKDNNIATLIDTRAVFHDAALSPELYATQYPMYLLDIEKPRDKTATPYKNTTPKLDINNLKISEDDIEDIGSVLDDPRPMVLTHALSTRRSNVIQKECFIYNVYKTEESAPWCQHKHIIKVEESNTNWKQEGWEALNRLGDEIRETAQREKATHIIILATGWNTEEYESYWDFSFWMKQLAEDFKGKGEFRPIFVGISWESEYSSSFFAKLPFASWSTKGNDADEIGFTWANYLLNDILKPVAFDSGTQLVAIGHSFGSRIVLGSHYVRDIIVRQPRQSDSLPLTLIGLQAAFPTGRFSLTEGWEHPYNANYKDPATVVITTSTLDKATGTIGFGTGYIGGDGGIKELTENKQAYESFIALPVFATNETGQPATDPNKQKVSVYNATPFVNCELPGTESGAHSDVYDKEMGHFVGEIIRNSKKPMSP